MQTIYTHASPDMDAATSTWLVANFGVEAHTEVRFLGANEPMPDTFFAVVDRGGVYNPDRRQFDHHGFEGRAASETSASEQVLRWIADKRRWYLDAFVMSALTDLVEVVTDADGRAFTGERAQWSFRHGLHAVFSAWKAQHIPDADLINRAHEMLTRYILIACRAHGHTYQSVCAQLFADFPEYADLAASTAAKMAAAGEEYEACKVWASDDGRVVALENASAMATNYAIQSAGAWLVVWKSEVKDASGAVIGWARGVQANTELCGAGKAVRKLEKYIEALAWSFGSHEAIGTDWAKIAAEVKPWFRHPAEFVAGLTPKGDATLLATPMAVSLVSLASAFYIALDLDM